MAAFQDLQFPTIVVEDKSGENAASVSGPEKSCSYNFENTEDVLELDLPPDIALKKRPDLLVAEGFVKMTGHDVTSLMIRGLNHSSTSQSTFHL